LLCLTVSIERIRELLGADAAGATDEQLTQLRDGLSSVASQLFDDIREKWKEDPESVRWLSYTAETGEIE
jgi:hypothetical protein